MQESASPVSPQETAPAETPAIVDAHLRRRILADGEEGGGAVTARASGIFRNDLETRVNVARYLEDLERASCPDPSVMEAITFRDPVPEGELIAALHRWGVVVLPGLVADSLLAAFNAEFDALMARRRELKLQVEEQPGSILLRVPANRLDRGRFPATTAFFASEVFRRIAQAYLHTEAFEFNRWVYVHETVETGAPPSGALHFDVTRTLKFWIYLEDATADSGAMRAVPGSHLWIRNLREDFSARLLPKHTINNEVDEAAHPGLPICGPAGTVFVFDTDVAHGALPVKPGRRRRIMRGHTVEDHLRARSRRRAA